MAQIEGIFGTKGSLQRHYATATAVFLVLVIGIIFLFGHLISRSLSRRYIEDMLVGGREDARRIADDLDEQIEAQDLQVLEQRREQIYRSFEGILRRQVYESIVVTDREGRVVGRYDVKSLEDLPEGLHDGLEMGSAMPDEKITETETPYRIMVPLGDVGEVVLNVSRARINQRVGRLQRELLTQTVAAAVLTLATLVVAFVLVWLLVQRTRRLEAKQHDAEELAALGTLAANLAHEIRNPLNSINLNLELLDEDLGGDVTDARSSLSVTRREVGRLGKLVSDFLTYARPSEPRLAEIRIAALMKDVCDFLHAEATSMGVHLRLGVEIPDVAVVADESQLRQVILNLVLNAIQSVSDLQADRRVVELSASSGEDEVALEVIDRGDGIADVDLGRVREAFFTKRRGGSGLGLAIAERFTEVHGGRVELENLNPHGFTARIVLPVGDDAGKMSE